MTPVVLTGFVADVSGLTEDLKAIGYPVLVVPFYLKYADDMDALISFLEHHQVGMVVTPDGFNGLTRVLLAAHRCDSIMSVEASQLLNGPVSYR